MKTWCSFLVRCWLTWDAANEKKSIYEITHVQSGDHQRFHSLHEADQFMLSVCEEARKQSASLHRAQVASLNLSEDFFSEESCADSEESE